MNKKEIDMKSVRTHHILSFCVVLIVVSCSWSPLYSETNKPAAESRDSLVKRITTICKFGKALDWCSKNDLIALAKPGEDGYFDVFVMKPDGSNEKCLTCNSPGCPQKHNGNPAWHPSGKYFVFTAEKKENSSSPKAKQFAIPGTGINCDLWLGSHDGKKFYQLTDLPMTEPAKSVIHPQFSHDGEKLLWAERVGRGDPWGTYALKVARFVFDEKGPRLEQVKTYQPGQKRGFYEGHAFSGDDEKILFSGDLESGQPIYGLDIYELTLETEELKRLTESFSDWDEHAHYSPDGKRIAWMSSRGFNLQYGSVQGHAWKKDLKADLWIMNADGSDKRRVTYFNEPGHPDYLGSRAVVADSAWSPDGKKIVATVAYENKRGRLISKVVMIELALF